MVATTMVIRQLLMVYVNMYSVCRSIRWRVRLKPQPSFYKLPNSFNRGRWPSCPSVRQEICQQWPQVTSTHVKDRLAEYFKPELFSPHDIMMERRELKKLLVECK